MKYVAIIALFILLGCDRSRTTLDLNSVAVPVGSAGKHIESVSIAANAIKAEVKPVGELKKKFEFLEKELALAKNDVTIALSNIKKTQVQANNLAKERDEARAEYQEIKTEYEAHKEKCDSAIWTRNWIIVGLVASGAAAIAWIFRKQIAAIAVLAGS